MQRGDKKNFFKKKLPPSASFVRKSEGTDVSARTGVWRAHVPED